MQTEAKQLPLLYRTHRRARSFLEGSTRETESGKETMRKEKKYSYMSLSEVAVSKSCFLIKENSNIIKLQKRKVSQFQESRR